MKIALIGDLQFSPGEEPLIAAHMAELASLGLDRAVFLGDMGAGGSFGAREGFQAGRDLLERLPCPSTVLLGNHDVEKRPAELIQWYRELFGHDELWQAVELDGAFLLCLSVEPQPGEDVQTVHALHVSNEQFEWAQGQLMAHRDVPTIVCTHAPVAGSGLRSLPAQHAAATDAYLDHGFQALRWRELIRQHPQIRLWCSAHFHMSHDELAAISHRDGVMHVSCGVMTSAARDGSRQTRILDLHDGAVDVCTLDHRTHRLRTDATLSLDGKTPPTGRFAKPGALALGDDQPRKIWLDPAMHRRYIATEKGILWEIDERLDDFNGALLRSAPAVNALYRDGDTLIIEHAEGCLSLNVRDPGRFDRLGGRKAPNHHPCPAPTGPKNLLEEIP